MSLQWKTLATLTDAFFENTAADPAILLYCSLPLCVFKKRLSILRIDIPALRCGQYYTIFVGIFDDAYTAYMFNLDSIRNKRSLGGFRKLEKSVSLPHQFAALLSE